MRTPETALSTKREYLPGHFLGLYTFRLSFRLALLELLSHTREHSVKCSCQTFSVRPFRPFPLPYRLSC